MAIIKCKGFTTNPGKCLHAKADSTSGEDQITPFRKWILLYFETEVADKLGTNSASDSFSKPYLYFSTKTKQAFAEILKSFQRGLV
ncbi:hypothetical protein ABET15_12395 [Heyndrickxia faecalis]|uniref:Uncharacterized protein n=1 Tax=Heyndrickxia coagulans 36D1 TaxID=345219 RepID=G2TIT7_HEYCO|nr:hypothetical protein [Heyndrickxia coagulans]AEP00560.1 hypothetical protein Bcoa_1354 [Heyndrickxia coagulans 36D1]AWP38658.1 hypothetical protein CYJ15_17715 [Heyndrickxia coagulans]KYC63641.1 hypothetical protein B4100_1485 [Heyndrickxia coagulans]QDI60963.1 hypothetical protein DXF96_05165 [Heyndrickxia coagulans]